MKELKNIILASYGGSGSTFLRDVLEAADLGARIVHAHAVPNLNSKYLGLLLPNKHNQCNEGQFSNTHFYDPNHTLIVFICRLPSMAITSRYGYQHFMNIWASTEYHAGLALGSADGFSEDDFDQYWQKCVSKMHDPMRTFDHLYRWIAFMKSSPYKSALLKYEKVPSNVERFASFIVDSLGLSNSHYESLLALLGGFSPKINEPDPTLRSITAKSDGLFARLKSYYEFFPEHSNSLVKSSPNVSLNSASTEPPIVDEPLVVVFTGFLAGAGDTMSRIIDAYDILSEMLQPSAIFKLTTYINYHSPDIDYLRLFGFTDLLDTIDLNEADQSFVEYHSFEDFYELLMLNGRDFFDCGLTHVVDLGSSVALKTLMVAKEGLVQSASIKSRLNYKRFVQLSTPREKTVTIHLRRFDLIRYAIKFDETKRTKLIDVDTIRPLLFLNEALQYLRDNMELLEISREDFYFNVVTDGIDLPQLDDDRPSDGAITSDAYNRIFDEINALQSRDLSRIGLNEYNGNLHNVIIGKGQRETLETYDCFAGSKIILTASSCFPNLFADLTDTKILWLDDHIGTSLCQ